MHGGLSIHSYPRPLIWSRPLIWVEGGVLVRRSAGFSATHSSLSLSAQDKIVSWGWLSKWGGIW